MHNIFMNFLLLFEIELQQIRLLGLSDISVYCLDFIRKLWFLINI